MLLFPVVQDRPAQQRPVGKVERPSGRLEAGRLYLLLPLGRREASEVDGFQLE
jgi:hypothetical protein